MITGFSKFVSHLKMISDDNGNYIKFEPNSVNLTPVYVLGKVRIEIDTKMYALSEYMTWTYKEDPVGLLEKSIICIIHQDRFLIKPTLQDVARIFEKAIKWNKDQENLTELKDHVSLIRYLYSHAMPRSRGSAFIGECFEILVYRYQGIPCEHSPKTLSDLEALGAPMWSTFRPDYDKTIILGST